MIFRRSRPSLGDRFFRNDLSVPEQILVSSKVFMVFLMTRNNKKKMRGKCLSSAVTSYGPAFVNANILIARNSPQLCGGANLLSAERRPFAWS